MQKCLLVCRVSSNFFGMFWRKILFNKASLVQYLMTQAQAQGLFQARLEVLGSNLYPLSARVLWQTKGFSNYFQWNSKKGNQIQNNGLKNLPRNLFWESEEFSKSGTIPMKKLLTHWTMSIKSLWDYKTFKV